MGALSSGMGGIGTGAGVATGGAGQLLNNTLNPLGDALGLGKQGEYYQAGEMNNPGLNAQNQAATAYGSNELGKNLAAYGTDPNMSLKDALESGGRGNEANYADMMAMSPVAAQKMATEQVQGNPILGQLFGKGGAMERANTEEQDLASRGYSLKPEDYEAYGQASGNIARMFGQQEQNQAQAMADRGMGQSGAAGAAFTGLQGNKMEQLGGMQRQIADNRMKMNSERLNNTRNYLSGLGQQGQSAIFGTRDRNLQGVQAKQGALSNAASNATDAYKAQQAAQMASMQNKQKQLSPTLGQSLGMGLSGAMQKAPESAGTAAMA